MQNRWANADGMHIDKFQRKEPKGRPIYNAKNCAGSSYSDAEYIFQL